MRRLLILLLILPSCRYRYTFGIYIPMQVGLVYSYTSKYDDTGEYESSPYYRPDTLYIIGDTIINGVIGRKVYLRKQNAEYVSRDTAIFYILNDTLFVKGRADKVMVPFFRFNYSGRNYIGKPIYSNTFIVLRMLYIKASSGDAWKAGEFSGRIRIYPEGFDTVRDSIREYSVEGTVTAKMQGYESLNLPYKYADKCVLISYDIKMVLGSIPVEFEAFRTWWCDNIGQAAYVMTATQFRTERKFRMELANVEFKEP